VQGFKVTMSEPMNGARFNIIADDVEIGESVQLGCFNIIHERVKLGRGTVVGNHCVIYPGTVVGESCRILDHDILGRRPMTPLGVTSRKLKQRYSPLVIGQGCVIGVGAVLYCGSKIGDNVLIGDYVSVREDCEIGDNCLIARFVSINYNSKIGNNVKIMDATYITGNMLVEDRCFISMHVVTANDNALGRLPYSEDRVRGPTIREGSAVGANASLLPGVVIGKNCIIAANCLVTRSVPDGKVVMGIPGKIVRDVDEVLR
jgi:acetyltransferase-like isoleucine patch superfamily enzyme